MKIIKLLKKNGVMSKRIEIVDYNMNLLHYDIAVLKKLFPDFKKTKEEEIVQFILEIFQKCDADNDKYDANLDEMITRYTLQTDKFPGQRKTNRWDNGGLYKDDQSAWGDCYNNYIDNQNDREL